MGDGKRIAFMRNMAEEHGSDPRMREFVVNRVLRPAGVAERDYAGQAAAMLRWSQEHVYYTNETGEQIQIPWVTLDWLTGDCDDKAILLAAMAQSLAMPWRFALAGKDKRSGRAVRWVEPYPAGRRGRSSAPPTSVDWSHIYVVLGWPPFRPTTWASAEPTLPPDQAPLGFDVVEHAVRGGGGGARMPELAGWGAAATSLQATAAQCGICTCPGDEDSDEEVPFLARMVRDMDWSMILRDTFVAVLSTLTIGLLLREGRRR